MKMLRCSKEAARNCPYKEACYGGKEYADEDVVYFEGSDCDKYNRGLRHPAAETADVEPVRGWIPCSERLPEKDGRYLVANATVGVIGVKSFAVEKRLNGRGQERRDVWWYLDDEWADQVATGITHWMPLPQPPEA